MEALLTLLQLLSRPIKTMPMPPTKIDSHDNKTVKIEADLSPEDAGETEKGLPQIILSVADVERTIIKQTIAMPKTRPVKSVRRWAIMQTCAKVDIIVLTGLRSVTNQS